MPSLFSLAGKTALVTGGGTGIGKMISAGFVAHGAKVYIASRNIAVCVETANELSGGAGNCIPLIADLATLSGIRALAVEFSEREGALNILVNNAGAASSRSFEEFSESDWDAVMDLNLKAPFFLTQSLLARLEAAASPDAPAKVINISSVDGMRLNARETYSYAASKAGLLHLTEHMACHLIARNIVVSCIAPGAFVSDMNVAARDSGFILAKRVPSGRIGTEEDIAGAALYLASRAGDYVVGATIVVDGGFAHALPTHGHPLRT